MRTDRLAEARREWGFKCVDLARLMPVECQQSARDIEAYEQGQRLPPPEVLEALCRHLCVREAWLLGKDDTRRGPQEETRRRGLLLFDQRRRTHPDEHPLHSGLVSLLDFLKGET